MPLFPSITDLDGHLLFKVHNIHHESVQVLSQGLFPLLQLWWDANIPEVVLSYHFKVLLGL